MADTYSLALYTVTAIVVINYAVPFINYNVGELAREPLFLTGSTKRIKFAAISLYSLFYIFLFSSSLIPEGTRKLVLLIGLTVRRK